MLRTGTDPTREADACWVLTAPHTYVRLAAARQWDAESYQQWLHRMLAASLLP